MRKQPTTLLGGWLRRVLFLAAFVVAVLMPALLVFLGKDQGAWLLVLAGISGMLMTRLDDVVSFTLGPLKAELRAAIQEANATVEQLRKLGLALAKPVLSKTLLTPRMDNGSSVEQYLQRDEIVAELRALGVQEDDITVALIPFHRGAEADHLEAILQAVAANQPDELSERMKAQALGDKIADFRVSVMITGKTVAVDDLRRAALDAGFATGPVQDAIADLEHYQKERTLRRPEAWRYRVESRRDA